MSLDMEGYFTLYGDDFDPEELYNELEFSEARIWYKGENRAGSKLLHKDYGWTIKIERKTIDASEVIKEVVKLIEPKIERITVLRTRYSLQSEIACCIYMNEEENPILYLKKELLARIAKLDCALDIDLLG